MIGLVIGGGVFGIMMDIFGLVGGLVVFSWVFVGIVMLMFFLLINNINKKCLDLKGGIFSYVEEGFGCFVGFISGWGYWFICWLGNVVFVILLMSVLGYFFFVFEGG